jgi:hypothetical protein
MLVRRAGTGAIRGTAIVFALPVVAMFIVGLLGTIGARSCNLRLMVCALDELPAVSASPFGLGIGLEVRLEKNGFFHTHFTRACYLVVEAIRQERPDAK